MQETQRVLAAIEEIPGRDVEEIARVTGLGVISVGLIVEELGRRNIIQDDDVLGRWGISRFGDEVMGTRRLVARS